MVTSGYISAIWSFNLQSKTDMTFSWRYVYLISVSKAVHRIHDTVDIYR